jgi:hypothetical protein
MDFTSLSEKSAFCSRRERRAEQFPLEARKSTELNAKADHLFLLTKESSNRRDLRSQREKQCWWFDVKISNQNEVP